MKITVFYEITQRAEITVEADDVDKAISIAAKIPARELKLGKKVWEIDRDRTFEKHYREFYPYFVGECTFTLGPVNHTGASYILGVDDCPVHGFGKDKESDKKE